MLKNYFKIALRNLVRNKIYSLINILGLSLGITCSMLILLWIQDELSYDTFHKNSENIYRVIGTQSYGDKTFQYPSTPMPLAQVLKNDFPDVKRVSRVSFNFSTYLLKYENKFFNEPDILFVDNDFLSIFSFSLKWGDYETALEKPNSIVLTKNVAEKYFGSENPIGKTILFQNEYSLEVTGILENLPEQSHLKFNALMNVEMFKKMNNMKGDDWDNNNLKTYIELEDNTDYKAFNSKFENLVKDNSDNNPSVLFLQPLSNIYLYTDFNNISPRIIYVYMFAGIALLILLIACTNFINLSTARSVKRAKEVGLRKVIGANKSQLVLQFFGEAILLSFLSLVVSCLSIELLMSGFNDLVVKKLEFSILNPYIIIELLSLTLIVGSLAGIYPALVLSSFEPVQILKGNFYSGRKGVTLRKALVITQFSIAIVLIISTLIIFSQLSYMQNRDLGFDKENIIYLNLNESSRKNFEALKQELLKNSRVQNVSTSSDLIGAYGSNSGNTKWRGKEKDESVLITFIRTQSDFIPTLGLELKEGRGFESEKDSLSILITESAAKVMRMEEPLNEKLTFEDDITKTRYSIIGVIKDYNYAPLQIESKPLISFYCIKGEERFVYIRINQGDMQEAVDQIKSIWEGIITNQPFEFQFLDAQLEKAYMVERRLSGIFGYFAFLAIFITCLGLLGLVSFTIETRTKEIGIRKVLGASVWSIILMISKDFLQLVVISIVISIPLGAYLMTQWLQNFAYRIDLLSHWAVFSGAVIVAFAIALITISTQALVIGNVNPVKILKDQ